MTIHKLPNNELFKQYDAEIVLRLRNPRNLQDTRRLLNLFKTSIGEFPPTAQLAKSFLAQYANRKPRTLYRYFMMLKPFMKWYGESIDDVHIKVPRSLAPNTPEKDIDELIKAIETKRSAKETIERDVLLVLVSRYAGLRREELSNLKVRDITETQIFVREGKGAKDRCIPLSENINERLHYFIKDKKADDSVFNQKPASISMKILTFAKKAGVTHLHTHTLRHRFATSLKDAGVDMYTIMTLMGHANLNTTQTYLAMSEDAMGEAIEKLDEDTSRRRTKISKPHEPNGINREGVDITKSNLACTVERSSDASAKPDGSAQFAQDTASAGGISRNLEQINDSLTYIKKKLVTTSAEVTSAPSKAASETNPISAGQLEVNSKARWKDLSHFEASDRLMNETQMNALLLALENHSECSEYDYAKLFRYLGYFSHEERRFISHEIRLSQNEVLTALEELILFLKLEFEIQIVPGSKSEAVMVLAPVEANHATDEQVRADMMTQRRGQLLSLVKDCKDAYSAYRLRIHTGLLV